MTSQAIRVLLCDDHQVLRQGLRLMLATDPAIEVVAEAQDGGQTVALALALKPDLVVTDLSMPHGSGLDAIEKIRTARPAQRILVLTMHDDEAYILECLQLGVQGYVTKEVASDKLLDAIHLVANGGQLVYRAPHCAGGVLPEHTAPPPGTLTQRELQVMRLIVAGASNRQIAASLFISEKTVETHRMHLMRKLNLHDRVSLLKYAVQHHWTEV